jgi:hypothetical protein
MIRKYKFDISHSLSQDKLSFIAAETLQNVVIHVCSETLGLAWIALDVPS